MRRIAHSTEKVLAFILLIVALLAVFYLGREFGDWIVVSLLRR